MLPKNSIEACPWSTEVSVGGCIPALPRLYLKLQIWWTHLQLLITRPITQFLPGGRNPYTELTSLPSGCLLLQHRMQHPPLCAAGSLLMAGDKNPTQPNTSPIHCQLKDATAEKERTVATTTSNPCPANATNIYVHRKRIFSFWIFSRAVGQQYNKSLIRNLDTFLRIHQAWSTQSGHLHMQWTEVTGCWYDGMDYLVTDYRWNVTFF